MHVITTLSNIITIQGIEIRTATQNMPIWCDRNQQTMGRLAFVGSPTGRGRTDVPEL